MDKLMRLKRDRARLAQEMRTIVDKAGAELRDLTSDEQEQYEGLEKEFEAIGRQIEMEERMRSFESQVDASFEDEEEPAIEPASGETRSAQGSAQAQNRVFDSLGEQLRAVMHSSTPGNRIDPRLLQVRAASGLNEANPSDGGFLVQHDFSAELLKNAWEYGILSSRVSTTPLGANSNGMTFLTIDETSRATGSRHGGVQIYWAAEAETKSASKPKFGRMSMHLHKLLGFCYATEEMLEDTIALGSIISEAFRDEFAFVLDDVILTGNGAGKPLGILNSDALVTVPKESAQGSGTIDYLNVLKMYARMHPRSLGNAVWLINQACIVQLAQMKLDTGTNEYPVYLPANGAAAAPFGTLFGRPIIPIEQASAPGTIGDIVFADLSQYRMITKDGLKATSSLHVRFLYDEQVFKFTYRCDGQPKMRKAITPYKGSDTISPFVALATRS